MLLAKKAALDAGKDGAPTYENIFGSIKQSSSIY